MSTAFVNRLLSNNSILISQGLYDITGMTLPGQEKYTKTPNIKIGIINKGN